MPSLFLNKHFKIIIHISFEALFIHRYIEKQTIGVQGYGMISLNNTVLLYISHQHFSTCGVIVRRI